MINVMITDHGGHIEHLDKNFSQLVGHFVAPISNTWFTVNKMLCSPFLGHRVDV